jgi:hypothetical protein
MSATSNDGSPVRLALSNVGCFETRRHDLKGAIEFNGGRQRLRHDSAESVINVL